MESYIFRLHGKILKPHFNLPKLGTSLLDFGCGQGAAANFFHTTGYDVYACDAAAGDIDIARIRFPHIQHKFYTTDRDPKKADYFRGRQFDVITACQALYYFSKSDFLILMKKIYDALKPGGVFFASMMSSDDGEFYPNSQKTDDEWLRVVSFKNTRFNCSDYYMFFVENEKDLCSKFSMFKPIFTGSYTHALRQDESNGKHLTFVGIKE